MGYKEGVWITLKAHIDFRGSLLSRSSGTWRGSIRPGQLSERARCGYAEKGAVMRKRNPHYFTTHWRHVRKLVLIRDNYQCQLRGPRCQGRADSVDHILPLVRGGSDALNNLAAACGTCNKSKNDSLVGPVNTIYW